MSKSTLKGSACNNKAALSKFLNSVNVNVLLWFSGHNTDKRFMRCGVSSCLWTLLWLQAGNLMSPCFAFPVSGRKIIGITIYTWNALSKTLGIGWVTDKSSLNITYDYWPLHSYKLYSLHTHGCCAYNKSGHLWVLNVSLINAPVPHSQWEG